MSREKETLFQALNNKGGNKTLKFDLQHFSEGDPDPSADPALLTQEQVDAQINAVIGKERAAADKREKDLQDSISAQIAEAVQKHQDLAGMNDVERLQTELDEERAARANLENQNKASKIKTDALAILSERNISATLVDFVVTEDAESTLARINTLATQIDAAVQAEVETRLKGKVPSTSSSSAGGEDNPFVTGNVTQQMQLMKKDPQLAEQLKNAAKLIKK